MQRGGDRRSASRVTKETQHNKARRFNAKADPPRRKRTHGSGSNAHSRTRQDSDSSSSSSLIATHVVASRTLRNTLRPGEGRESGSDSNSESHSDGSNQGQRHAASRAIGRVSNQSRNQSHSRGHGHGHGHGQRHGHGHGHGHLQLQRSSDRDDEEDEDNDDHDHDDEDHDPLMEEDAESRSDASNADASDLRNVSDDLSRGDENEAEDDNDGEELEDNDDDDEEEENIGGDENDNGADDEDEIGGGNGRNRSGQSRPSVKRTLQTKCKYTPTPTPTPTPNPTPTLTQTTAPSPAPPPLHLAPPPSQARASAGFTGSSGGNQRFTLSTEVMESRIQITPRVHGRFDSLPPHPRMLLHKGCLLRVGHCLRLHRHPSCFVIVGFDMHTPDAPLLCRKLSARTGSASHIPSTPGSVPIPIPTDDAAAPRLAGSTAADYALDSKPELYVIPLRIVVSVLPGIFLLRFADLAYVRPANIPALQSPPPIRQHPNNASAISAASSAANQPGMGVSIDGFLIEEIP